MIRFSSEHGINIHRKVFEQRVGHQTHFDSGAAATGFVKPNEDPLSPKQVSAIKNARAVGLDKPMDCSDVSELESAGSEALQHQILKAMINPPDFDLKTYKHRDSDLFHEPEAIHPLPHGPDHATLQFLLHTFEM